MYETTMPMTGIFTEADIRDDEQLGIDAFEETNSLLNNAPRVVGPRAHLILFAGDTKEKHRRNTKTADSFSLAPKLLQRPLHDAGHRGYFLRFMNSLRDGMTVAQLVNSKARSAP